LLWERQRTFDVVRSACWAVPIAPAKTIDSIENLFFNCTAGFTNLTFRQQDKAAKKLSSLKSIPLPG